MRSQQLAERLCVEEAHMKELQEFNEIWDKKVFCHRRFTAASRPLRGRLRRRLRRRDARCPRAGRFDRFRAQSRNEPSRRGEKRRQRTAAAPGSEPTGSAVATAPVNGAT